MDSKNIRNRAERMLSLEGKVAIVTGAASGIGRGIAVRLAEMGAAVGVLDKNAEGGMETVAGIQRNGGNAMAIACDVRSRSECRQAVERTIAAYGRADILCNNAGMVIRKDVMALEEEEWDEVLNVTLKSAYLMSREVIPHMTRNGGGAIINTGSGWSLKGGAKAASYCAAKAGLLNLTRAMAIDHGKDNIRVNCVCPGDINTPMLASECRQLGENPEQFMKEAASRPLHRIGTTDDVANAVLFLASDMAKWITGTHLVVDGGGLA
ncbi:MAG: SDR family oxidoreductase [Terriglobales bacterium]|jgi:NAD(P)-dependent dehydrogenase (short-subunit alcohol dehydrogenase family)